MIRFRFALPTLVLLCLASPFLRADENTDASQRDASVQKGIRFLKSTQAADGSWTSPHQPGITGLVVQSLMLNGVPLDDPSVASGLKHLESHIKSDGGIYDENTTHKNYETAIAVMALITADEDGRYRAVIDKAVDFLKQLQWDDEADGRENPAFGGAGYGRSQRPDLSNTTFFLEALRSAGVSPSDPAIQNALVFVSRCQNLDCEQNNTPFADKINDGGFYYTPAGGGSSPAGTTPDGGLRSYASMTYAGLKSMIYAGLTPEDPRVRAAQNWIRQFYTLDENPGMGQLGLFYYFQTFSKTLNILGVETFEDSNGVSHNWRRDLVEKLRSLQQENGSWVNPAERWMEGDPNIVTAYALLSLSYAEPAP